jgi:hypothetical protein
MRLFFPPRAFAVALATAALGCGGGDGGTGPSNAASVSASQTSGITATVGTAVSPSPTFVVRDASGTALSNVSVTVTVASGGGTLTGAPTKSSAGGTSVGTWTLGNTAGVNTLRIEVNGLSSPLIISATGTADVATQLTVSSGNNQTALAAATLANALMYKVGDRFNNGVAGAVVSFSVIAGGGTLPPGSVSVTTDGNGIATAPTWTMGKSTGVQTLRGTSGAFAANATATVISNYTLEVRFFGPAMDPNIQASFVTAAARIQGLLTGDVTNTSVSNLDVAGQCGATGVSPLTESIDDLIVYAQVAPNDGPGGILGSAGQCYIRDQSELALIGIMNFDSADLQNLLATNRLDAVILHEMLHTVGIGTLWSRKFQVSQPNTPSVAFIGQQAVAGCLFHGGTASNQCGGGTVPVEAGGGSGTANVHWRESTSGTGIGFNTEMMTGFIEAAGIPMPLSRMSIGSLADIGYTVNLLPYDAYTVPSTAAISLGLIREAQGFGGRMLLNEIIREPVATVDILGRVTPIKPRR